MDKHLDRLLRIDPQQVALIVLVILIAVGLLRGQAVPPPAPIIIVATPTTMIGMARVMERQALPPAAMHAPATAVPTALPPEPTTAPAPAEPQFVVLALPQPEQPAPTPVPPPAIEPGYMAHTDAGDLFVPDDATPVPADAPYDGPFLAPATEGPPSGPRYCTGFGDWRDYDANYASSPVCRPTGVRP